MPLPRRAISGCTAKILIRSFVHSLLRAKRRSIFQLLRLACTSITYTARCADQWCAVCRGRCALIGWRAHARLPIRAVGIDLGSPERRIFRRVVVVSAALRERCRLCGNLHRRIMTTEPVIYQLRRPNSDKSWGFALQGGADQGLPVFVHKVGVAALFLVKLSCVDLWQSSPAALWS